MTDLTTLHKNARSLILSLREGLETLEKADEQAGPRQYSTTQIQRSDTTQDSGHTSEGACVQVPQYAVATGLARDLEKKLADLQVTAC